MAIEQALVTWAHLVSAAIWVGGSLFIGVVLAPVLKRSEMTLEQRMQMMITVGRRFNKIAVPSLVILIVTGVYTSQGFFFSGEPDILLGTSYGNVLLVKTVLVVLLVATFAVHVRVIRGDVERRVMDGALSDDEIRGLRKRIIILGELTVVISVAILFLAAVLDSGA